MELGECFEISFRVPLVAVVRMYKDFHDGEILEQIGFSSERYRPQRIQANLSIFAIPGKGHGSFVVACSLGVVSFTASRLP